MPSGSRKRKSSKKPKAPGGPPELDAGLEEAMENNGMDVGEPNEFEGDPEAMAERGLEGKEMNGGVPDEGDALPEAPREGFQTDETAPDQDEGAPDQVEGGRGNPPSQDEPEPEIPAGIEAEAPTVFELEGQPAQGETEPQIDTPLWEFDVQTPEETKPEMESADAAPSVADATPDASPNEIKPDADIGLDAVESSKELSVFERESVLDAAPIGSESGMDESSVKTETNTDGASADIEPEIEKARDEFQLETDAAPAEVESEIGEPLVEVKPEADATPYIELETNDAPDEVPVEVELEDVAPAESKPETDEAQVVELETAAPVDIEPETEEVPVERELETDAAPMDAEADAEEAPAERELAIDAAPVNVEPVTDAAPADTEAATDMAQVEMDASPDEMPSKIDAASPENEIESDVNAAPVEAEQDEMTQAEIKAAPEPEPEWVALVEGEQETEPEPKPLDVAEDTSLEPPQEIEPESEVVATDEGKPNDEASVETKAEERGSAETESDQQDLIGGEMEAPLEMDPELEVEMSRGFELDAEAETPLEAELGEAEPDGKGAIETESDQQGLLEIEPDQSRVKEYDQQLQQQEGEAEFGESEDNQPSEVQPQVADASEVPVIEDEPPAITCSDEAYPVDDFTPTTSSSEASDNANNERTAIVQEPEEGDDIPPSETVLEGEGESRVGVSDNQDSGGGIEQTRGTAVDYEEGGADETPAESKEDIREEQERAVDAGHDEDGAASAPAGICGETEESIEQELAIEVPPADVEESTKDITEQERAVDFGHDEDGVVLASAGNGVEAEPSSEQELGIELPPADVVDVEEFAEGPPPSDQPLSNAQDLSMGLSAAAYEPPSAESEQRLSATLPSPESEMTSDAPEPQNNAVTPANEEKVASEPEFNLESAYGELERGTLEEEAASSTVVEDERPSYEHAARDIGEDEAASSTVAEAGSFDGELPTEFLSTEQSLNATLPSSDSEMASDAPGPQEEAATLPIDEKVASEYECNACGELERDIGEEEAASSTVAESGSVLNDFDERGSYEQELPTDFPSTDQDADIPDFKEFDDNSSIEAHESEIGSREQLDSEPSPAEKVDVNAGCGLDATSEQQEVLLEGAEEAKSAEDLHSALVEEVSSNEHLLSSPQPEQVVQGSGENKVPSSKKVVILANEEPRTAEEEKATCEDDKVAANSILTTSLPMLAGDELISKAFTYLENGHQKSLPIYESSVHQSEANNTDKAEIHAIDTREVKEAEHNPVGGDTKNDADEAPVESASLNPEGRDMKGVQAFRRESTQEASLPVVVPAQDRALEHASVKSAERPSGGGTMEHRTKLLGCCGLFDLLVGKN